MPYDQQGSMSPMQMLQLAQSMTQPRQAFSMTPMPYSGGGGGMQSMPYSGDGSGGMQNLPDPLDGYSDDQIARAYYKRQNRSGTRIGNKSYGP